MILAGKKPISALKLIHNINHTQVNRCCDIREDHISLLNTLEYTIGERIYNLHAGLYKVLINNNEYIIDIYFDLSDGDFLIIENEYTITLYMASDTIYPIIPYKIKVIKNSAYARYIETVNDSIDALIVSGKTKMEGDPSLISPMKINRTSSLNIITKFESETNSVIVPLKHSLGKLPNGTRDYIVINSEQMIAHDIINTSKEILSGNLDWQFKEEYSNSEYYVFFAKYAYVKHSSTFGSIRCSHLPSMTCSNLISKYNKNNCIAVSDKSHENGIWIKIAASILDIHGKKDLNEVFKKWIFTQAVSENPIYIEYELTNTIYNTILIDEYHAKTWYPRTIVILDGDYGFSVFYKSLYGGETNALE